MAEDFAIGKALVIPQSVINKIADVDTKINLIAADSEKMATHFTSAMTRMSGSTDRLITKLGEIQSRIGRIDLSKFSQSVSTVGQGSEQVEKFASAITKAAAAINKYNQNKGKSDSTKEVDTLNKEIEALRRKTEQLQKLINTQNRSNSSQSGTRAENKAIDAYNRAMASSEAIVTQRINKIAKLRQAEEMLTAQGSKYEAQIKRIGTEIERLNRLNQGQVDAYGRVKRSQSNLMNTSDQLMRKLALIFSVSQIQGYIEKLIQVRGEFELQNTALASILQNKEKADLLFGRITELAVKSPFTVKELVTYTKSLSAYQVEYEKLYDTTKMLADVSAGLGVDMQRLILAFGQVKAANFLRGTETRQFTEAGINMLGELAKYYSELEGRIVSVSEVQDRQFKKMISFKDVEEVFKRLTSAGGMFYNMQERQAETLAGQVSNLQDSIDIMLNDIGKANQGVLSNFISIAKSLIENWREVAVVLEPIVTMLLTQRLLVKGIIPFVENIRKSFGAVIQSIKGATAAQEEFNSVSKANAWATVATVIVGALWAVYKAIEEAKRAQEELNNIISDGAYDAAMSQANYKRLADVVASSTASYQEQKDALDELKRTYSEILPQHYLEADAIKAMKGNYDEATAAINQYIAAKTKEKEIQQINETYGDEISENQKELAEYIKESIKVAGKSPAMTDINVVIAEFRRQFEEGLVKTVDDANKLLNDLLSKRFGQNINLSFAKSSFDWLTMSPSASYPLESFFNTLVRLQDKVKEVNASTLEFEDATTINLNKKREILDGQLKEVDNALNLIATKYSGGAGSELITDSQISDAKSKLIEYANAWGIPEEKIKEMKGGAYEISEISKAFNIAALKTFASQIAKLRLPTNQIASARMYLQELRKEIDSFDSTPLQKYVSNIIISMAQLNGVSLDGLVDAFARADEGVDVYSKRIKGKIDTLTEQLRLYSVAPMLTGWTEADAKNAEKQKKILEAVYNPLNASSSTAATKKRQSTANKAQKSELDKLKERIDLIKKARDEYEKLIEYYDKGKAKLKVTKAFSGAFKEVGLSIDMDFDISGVIKKIENLTNKAGKEGRKAINEALAPLKSERDIDLQTKGLDKLKERIDSMFSGYELSIELQKNGLDGSLVEQLFNVDTLSLDTLKKKLSALEPELKKYGDKGVEVFKDAEKKITDNEQKELNERLKKYSTYLKQSVTERVKIELEAQKKIAEVQATSEFTPQQKSSIINKIKEEASKQKDEQTWKDFQGTDMYIRMFEDLESASTKSLDFMLAKLNSLRTSLKNLSPTDLKEIVNQIEKIQDVILNRNPFEGLASNIKDVIKYQKEAKKLNEDYIESSKQEDLLKGLIESQQLATEEERKRYSKIVEINGASSEEAAKAKENLDIQEDLLNTLVSQLEAQGKITKEVAEQIRNGETQTKNLNNRKDAILGSASQTLSSLMSMFEDFGVEIDESTRQALEGVDKILSSLQSIDITKPFSIVTGVLGVIGGIGKTIGSIFTKSDASYEKKIERQQDLVESLQKSYEHLYDTIENGLSIDAYSKNSALIKNLTQQINSYQKMIAAERDKKNTDEDKIKDWQNSIDDIYDQIDELYKNLKENLIGDFKSVAEQLGDAIADAFENGTDAAEAWGDSVKEIVSDMVKNILVQKLIEPGVQQILDQMFSEALPNTQAAVDAKNNIDELRKQYEDLNLQYSQETDFKKKMYLQKQLKALEDQIALLEEEYNKASAAAEDEVPNITQGIVDNTIGALEQLGDDVINNPAWDMLKELLQGSQSDTMSGLQKGISSVTEETAQVLESLLNSMRFYVADTNADIKNIYNFLVNMPIESPLMQEMRAQTEYMRTMVSIWSSLSMTKQGVGGKCLRVNIV